MTKLCRITYTRALTAYCHQSIMLWYVADYLSVAGNASSMLPDAATSLQMKNRANASPPRVVVRSIFELLNLIIIVGLIIVGLINMRGEAKR